MARKTSTTESPVTVESESSIIETETLAKAAESSLVTALHGKAKAAWVKAQSKRHALYITSHGKESDMFGLFKFQTFESSFAILRQGETTPRFVSLESFNLATDSPLVSVSLEAYSTFKPPYGKETVVRATASPILIAVRVGYNPDLNRLELADSPTADFWRYSKSKGFTALDDSGIGKALPKIDRATLFTGIMRKLRAYVQNNAESVNDRQAERNGTPTLFGLYQTGKGNK